VTITILSSVPVAAALVAVVTSCAFGQEQLPRLMPAPDAHTARVRDGDVADTKRLPPLLAKVYEADPASPATRGHRVEFTQTGTRLVAVWKSHDGAYARSLLEWDADRQAFRGTTVTKSQCFTDDSAPRPLRRFVDVVVREEIHLVSERVIRDRWTRPLKFDCANGALEIFRWEASLWSVPVQ
jgi:hypothetical protein